MAKTAPNQETGRVDRVSLIRKMLEGNQKTDIYSPNYVSRKPWDVAAKRQAKDAAAAEKAFFDPSKVFKGMKISVEDAIEQGDKVVVKWRLRGTWAGSFGGIKATGKPINVTGINVYRFVADKIVEEEGEVDWATFAKQAFGGAAASADLAQACSNALDLVSRPQEKFPGAGPIS